MSKNFVSNEDANALFSKVGNRLGLRPKTWTGTHAEWDILSPTDQAKYEYVNFTDDFDQYGGVTFDVLADEFDAANAYAVGDVVVHDGYLYEFTSAHTANDPWDATEVDQKSVTELIEAAEPTSFTTAQVNTIIGLLD